MQAREYFQSYHHYFWQWEEDTNVIAIPGHTTIAYQQLVCEILQHLSPQGLPPFGSLLLALIATNPHGNSVLTVVDTMMKSYLQSNSNTTLSDAMAFLHILAQLPDTYKTGRFRTALFQMIFEGCHGISSVKNSTAILQYLTPNTEGNLISIKLDFSTKVFSRDFRVIGLLLNKYQNVSMLIKAMASLPDIPAEDLEIQEDVASGHGKADFVQQLVSDRRTFYIGALITRLWGGLHLPAHSALQSQQPLGGYSDLTTKGDIDKLLVSEFANDDTIFLNRIVNNEALYIQREVPPVHRQLKRIFLLDISLKNWGTPKILSFATMLAFAKHPTSQKQISSSAYTIGNMSQLIDITSIESIIESLQILDGTLHAANGLDHFLRSHTIDNSCEVIVCSEHKSYYQPQMQQIIQAHSGRINYVILSNSTGSIEVFKKHLNSTTLIHHIELPLNALWANPPIKGEDEELSPMTATTPKFPILVRNPLNSKKILRNSDGQIYQITADKMLLRFFDSSYHANEKGWELLIGKLPSSVGEFEIGTSPTGTPILFIFLPQNKEFTLLDISTGQSITGFFKQWRALPNGIFVFYEGKFYYGNHQGIWSIDTSGIIEETEVPVADIFTERHRELESTKRKYSSGNSIFKNITSIFINNENHLVFNKHKLQLNSSFHLKMNTSKLLNRVVEAVQQNSQSFSFPDGSVIDVHRCGILTLSSSNREIPPIYIPTVIDASLGMAAGSVFAGNDYYYKHSYLDLSLIDPGSNHISVIKLIQEYAGLELSDAKRLLDTATFPCAIGAKLTEAKANIFKEKLELIGAKAEIHQANLLEDHQEHLEKIPTKSFYDKYIASFITTILDHGNTR